MFFFGQSVSIIGTWVHSVAMSWLVYRLSGSALLLGLTSFASMIPILVFAPISGLFADRVDRRKLLLWTQFAAAIHAAAMAALAYAEVLSAWHVIVLATLMGLVQAMDTPLRQSFVPDMVPAREDIPSAVALGALMQQAGRLVGPTIAGLLLVYWSEALCFLVNAVSKLAVIWVVASMVMQERARIRKRARVFAELAEGMRYAWDIVPLRLLLPNLAIVSFMVTPYQALMPIFAAEIYHGGADTLGYLMGAAGVGGALSVLVLAARKDVRGLARITLAASIASGVALMVFSQLTSYWLALVVVSAVGAGYLAVITGTSTIVQIIVEDTKRGRVMALFTMSFMGMVPVGSLAAGAVADYIGATLTLAISGACCTAAGMAFWTSLPMLRAHIRAHYLRLGIIKPND